jgi:hypothetical protein
MAPHIAVYAFSASRHWPKPFRVPTGSDQQLRGGVRADPECGSQGGVGRGQQDVDLLLELVSLAGEELVPFRESFQRGEHGRGNRVVTTWPAVRQGCDQRLLLQQAILRDWLFARSGVLRR